MGTRVACDYSELLNRFGFVVAQPTQAAPNVFRLAGFPRREVVSSNIWAYFLDPSESHRMGTLFLDSLQSCLDKKTWRGAERVRRSLNGEAVDLSVLQEYSDGSASRNRIDIVIRTRDYVIGIENKVDASLYNDLDDYGRKIEETFRSTSGSGLSEVEMPSAIVLVVLHQGQLRVDDKKKIPKYQYVVALSYDELFDEILGKLGAHLLEVDPRALDLLEQFIENFSEVRNMKSQQDWQSAVNQFLEQVSGREEQLFALRRSLRTYLDGCKEILALVDAAVAKEFVAAPVEGYSYELKHPKPNSEEGRKRKVGEEILFAEWHEHMLMSDDGQHPNLYLSVYMPIDKGFEDLANLDLRQIICAVGREWNDGDPRRRGIPLGVRIDEPVETIAAEITSTMRHIVNVEMKDPNSFFSTERN